MNPEDVEVLRAFAAGRSTAEVAASLNVSKPALSRRLTRIRRELGAPNTIAAIVTAVRRGIL